MRILIGVDGSPYSDAALDEVSRRPWPKGSEILVLNAFELPLAGTPEVWALPPDYYERLDRICREQADAIVKAAIEKLSSLGNDVLVASKTVLGPPKSVILEEADTWNPDLIEPLRLRSQFVTSKTHGTLQQVSPGLRIARNHVKLQ